MLLFQTILLASLSSGTPVAPVPAAAHSARSTPERAKSGTPTWLRRLLSVRASWKKLELSIPCASLSGGTAPCVSLLPERSLAERLPAAGTYKGGGWTLPRRNDAFRTQGGFVHLDVLSAPGVRLGPELSWSSPDSPREDLPKMRLLTPGWGFRFALNESAVAVGVSACSRLLMVGRGLPLVDPLTSEARVEFQLP